MSKLPQQYRFLDLSDYGRPIAEWIAHRLKNTRITPIHLTWGFILCGILAIVCILNGYRFLAAFFLISKSILDAADGDLARVKNTPSHVGRYFDSNSDLILNFFLFLTFWHITDGSLLLMILAFISIELQGTLYHYYYVILRNKVGGDKTSRIFEKTPPMAMPGESQQLVNRLFRIYYWLYSPYDKMIHFLDPQAVNSDPFPNWFMSLVSLFGLGFQLLIMAIMVIFHLENFVIPFFIYYSVLILVFIGVRRSIL